MAGCTTTPSEEELLELLHKTFPSDIKPKFTTINGFVLLSRYSRFEEEIQNLKIFDSDIWICGFPKCGTTWLSEIIWLIANDLNYEGAKSDKYLRYPLLDLNFLIQSKDKQFWKKYHEGNSFAFCQNINHPRTIRSHLPLSLFPKEIVDGTKKPKLIHVSRHPIDVCVSYYYHVLSVTRYTGSFEDFCKLFLYGKINYGPYYKHVSSFWQPRKNYNILFLTYEEMSEDIRSVITKIATFLEKSLTDAEISHLEEHVSFKEMKLNSFINNRSTNNANDKSTPFIRSGKVGGYKNEISQEYISKFEKEMQRWFNETGIDFSNINKHIFTKMN